MQTSEAIAEDNSLAPQAPVMPPPPPPPPIKFSLTQNYKCENDFLKEVKLTRKSSQNGIISALRHVTHNFYIENPANLFSLYYPVSPVIQQGRCCGIVALSMASQLICNISVDDILSLAKTLNFTKEGEMFSAFNMATLATTLLDCNAVVLDDLYLNKVNIFNHICDGNPILIPYDADKNHFPCTNQGLTAHWAVITGLCFTVPNKDRFNGLNSETIHEFPELNIFVIKDGTLVKNLLQYSEKVFFYAHQGKSRHLAAWDVNDLFKSNKNMYEVTKKYSSDQLVLPGNDSLSELRNKAILIKRKNQIP